MPDQEPIIRTPGSDQQPVSGRSSRAHARYAPASAANGRTNGHTGSQALGGLLRRLRTGHGLSTRRVADRAGVARSTIQRLERGETRPRLSTLGWIAGGIDPDRRAEILGQLAAAAAGEIAADSDAWTRRQVRLHDARMRAGRTPLPAAWERRIRLRAASESMWEASSLLLDRALSAFERDGAGPVTGELLGLVGELRHESGRLAGDSGVRIAGVQPPRRWRGDPADVSSTPPPLADLAAVRRWLRAWQVREGRRQPRTLLEREIAATGSRERQKVKNAPEPPPARPAEIRRITAHHQIVEGCLADATAAKDGCRHHPGRGTGNRS
jgi:transcriptional regulator with XRE-family HTH domain